MEDTRGLGYDQVSPRTLGDRNPHEGGYFLLSGLPRHLVNPSMSLAAGEYPLLIARVTSPRTWHTRQLLMQGTLRVCGLPSP